MPDLTPLPTLPAAPNSITRPKTFVSDADATFGALPGLVAAWNANVPIVNEKHAETVLLAQDVGVKYEALMAAGLADAAENASAAGEAASVAEAARQDIQANWQAKLDAADQSATDASLSATTATTAAGLAESAKTAAEAAKDAAFVNADMHPSVTAGLAAVSDGQQFQVLSSDAQTITRYRRDSVSVATAVASFLTADYMNSIFASGFLAERTGYLFSWVDDAGALLAGIKLDGTFWSAGINLTASAEAVDDALTLGQAAATAASVVLDGPERSNYLFAFTDADNRSIGGILKNGELEILGTNISATISALGSSLPLLTSTSSNIYAWGDSLTENGSAAGGWVLALAAATNRAISNKGLGGQSAQKIIGRQGSYITTVTVAGNQIPVSGAVDVTVSNAILDTSGTVATAACSLNGVVGTLSKSGNQYVFTRTTNGDAVTVWPGTTIDITTPVDARYCTNIIWVGRNHFNYVQTLAQYDAQIVMVLDTIDKAVRSLNPLNPKFMVVGVTNGSTEALGSDGYNAILSCNAQIQARYPRQFLDIRRVLLESGTGSGQDAIDYANGVIPASLRSDTQHFNASGNAVIASAFQAKLSYLGI